MLIGLVDVERSLRKKGNRAMDGARLGSTMEIIRSASSPYLLLVGSGVECHL